MATVLIVDDSSTMRSVVKRSVMMAGVDAAEIAEATDGLVALEAIAAAMPRLVLCDVNMPRLDGTQLLEELRRRYGAAMPPVVMITSVANARTLLNLVRLGAAKVIRKPFDPNTLANDLRGFLPPPPPPPPPPPVEYKVYAAPPPRGADPGAYAPRGYAPELYGERQFVPESYAPPAHAPEPYTSAPYAPSTYAPEQYVPEQYAPEQYAPEQYAPEQYAPQSYVQPYAAQSYETPAHPRLEIDHARLSAVTGATVREVLETMAFAYVTPVAETIPVTRVMYHVAIPFTGVSEGRLALAVTAEVATNLAISITGTDPGLDDAQRLDAVAELANVVIGELSRKLPAALEIDEDALAFGLPVTDVWAPGRLHLIEPQAFEVDTRGHTLFVEVML